LTKAKGNNSTSKERIETTDFNFHDSSWFEVDHEVLTHSNLRRIQCFN